MSSNVQKVLIIAELDRLNQIKTGIEALTRSSIRYMQQRRRIRSKIRGLQIKLNLLVQKTLEQQKARKRYWMKPRHSTFWEEEIPASSDEFFKENFRMTRETFAELMHYMQNIGKKTTNFREPIPLDKRVAIAVYSLGSSAEYRTIGNLFGVSKSSVCNVLKEFCTEVWKVMKPLYLNKYPLTENTVRDCVEGFKRLGFPQCMSAVDGCHIEIRPRISDATDYYNYKGWYSTVLLASVDYRYRFMYVNVGAPGRCNDSQIFEKSALKQQHLDPILKRLSVDISGVNVPVVILGDSAFRLSDILMKPYPYRESARAYEKNYNYALSKCRRVVENTFGQYKARFRRIGKGLDNRIDNVNLIIKSACVLHNFLNEKNDAINNYWLQQLQEQEETHIRPQPQWTCSVPDNDPTAENIRAAIARSLQPATSGET